MVATAGADSAPHRQRRRWRRILAGLLVAVLILAVLLLSPLLDARPDSQPDATQSYEEGMRRAADLLARDGDDINPRCRSQVLDQGARTERAVVLLHGYTNCPEQFGVIAAAYAAAGYNVVVPRLPAHGEADRMTRALSDLTLQDIAQAGDEAVDIAAGLGGDVVVVGLSGGGTLAGWLAAERDEVTEAVLIAPLVVPRTLPRATVGPVARVTRFAPDVYLWWDSAKQEQLVTPPYAYPRFSLRSLGAFLALGRAAQREPGRSGVLDRLTVVKNENDLAVSEAGVDSLGDVVGTAAAERVDHTFTENLAYRHDLVDPEGDNAAQIDGIYAVLGPLLGLPALAGAPPG